MKKHIVFFLIAANFGLHTQAQQLVLRKGVVLDSLPVQDSVASELKLYLPRNFETNRTWPLIFICTENGKAIQTLRFMTEAAEDNGYILATSEAIQDTIPLTEKVLRINSGLEKLKEYLPVDLNRIYTAGYDLSGQLAVLIPSLIRPVRGVLAIGSNVPSLELIKDRGSYEFVGIMGRSDYLYPYLRSIEEDLDQKKISNHVLYHTGGHEWPESKYLGYGMQFLTLMAMKDSNASRDSAFIRSRYGEFLDYLVDLESRGEFLLAMDQIEEGLSLYEGLTNTDLLKDKRRDLRKNSTYKGQKREWEQVRLQEIILTEDYTFYLQEDVSSFNLNNLGWWNYQMGKIIKFKDSSRKEEKLMGQRLEGYLNALIADYINAYGNGPDPDEDALIFLFMLKTITAPMEYENYLKVISYTAKYGDFGTANFYLEELLKKGYRDADQLYNLPHTGLLRISPEFNKLIAQYLGQARYATE
ncbi:MAG: alpha/beta hydrolase [Flavobacteriaceae bacterium]|nr:MAG: alpha/beta hydrolase [Flavobacteriaceae bacterium]